MAAHVIEQLECVPADASHLVVSTGGNNALENIDWIRHGSARSVAEVLSRLAQIRADFQQEYRTMLGPGSDPRSFARSTTPSPAWRVPSKPDSACSTR